MIDQILSDGVVAAEEIGHLQFGANAIHAADKDGILVAGKFGAEEPAETADFTEYLGTMSPLNERLNAFLDFITQVDIHTSACISFFHTY